MGETRRSKKTGRAQVKWIEPVEAAVSAADYFECGGTPATTVAAQLMLYLCSLASPAIGTKRTGKVALCFSWPFFFSNR